MLYRFSFLVVHCLYGLCLYVCVVFGGLIAVCMSVCGKLLFCAINCIVAHSFFFFLLCSVSGSECFLVLCSLYAAVLRSIG